MIPFSMLLRMAVERHAIREGRKTLDAAKVSMKDRRFACIEHGLVDCPECAETFRKLWRGGAKEIVRR